MESVPCAQVLKPGEVYKQTTFGAHTVNRGALLLECEWDGGAFEAGLFIGGMFRSGSFIDGMFLGGVFWDGTWIRGIWAGGFDGRGIYRPRGDDPSCW